MTRRLGLKHNNSFLSMAERSRVWNLCRDCTDTFWLSPHNVSTLQKNYQKRCIHWRTVGIARSWKRAIIVSWHLFTSKKATSEIEKLVAEARGYEIFLSNTNYNGFETSTLPELSYPSTKLIIKKNCNLSMIAKLFLCKFCFFKSKYKNLVKYPLSMF